jgi:hypothetical protein
LYNSNRSNVHSIPAILSNYFYNIPDEPIDDSILGENSNSYSNIPMISNDCSKKKVSTSVSWGEGEKRDPMEDSPCNVLLKQ